MTPGLDEIRRAPKVALHDHLDGGLRPSTVAEIAAAIGHEIPAGSSLLEPHLIGTHSGSLEAYLESFNHTLAVMQRPEDLVRVAQEAVSDLAVDGVVYAELRWAPEQHQQAGLSLAAAVEAVHAGIRAGQAEAHTAGLPIVVKQILTARRETQRSLEIARLAVAERDRGVVGFDIAGAEHGYPAADHLAAFDYLADARFPVTAHAGEAYGLVSIEQALNVGRARRIGHGVRIVDDIESSGTEPRLGSLAQRLRDASICFELCPTSNLNTGVLGPGATIADHPFALLDDCGFNVTVNCDNRLMSRTTLSREFELLASTFGYTFADIERFTVNAIEAAFCDSEEAERLLTEVISPGFAQLSA